MSKSRQQLERAYRLIKRDRVDEAQQMIRPVLEEEPDNAHAWWLLAYASQDPNEIRSALHKVLDLDPDYVNAPKARDMLAALDERYPAGRVFTPAAGETTGAFEEELYSDVFASQDEEPIPVTDDLFGDVERSIFERADEEPLGKSFEVSSGPGEELDLSKLFKDEEEELDEEALARRDERGARPRGRGLRRLALILLVVIAAAVVVGLVYVLSGGEGGEDDPGALQEAQVADTALTGVLANTQTDLTAANLSSEHRALIAESSEGQTLFVEFCGQPTPELATLVAQGMGIAVRQAPAVENLLAAVGVSVNLCGAGAGDTLYRAVVPVADAIRYLDGEFGAGETGLAGFQATWKTS